MAGFLRYNRESNHPMKDSETILQEALTDCYPVLCEYCGEGTRPNLDLTWLDKPERSGQFCCSQFQLLWEWLLDQRSLDWTMSDPESHATPHEQPIMRGEKLSYKEASLEKGSKAEAQEAQQACHHASGDSPRATTEPYNTASNAIRYRHSTMCAGNAGWTVSPESHTQIPSKAETPETEVEMYRCEHDQGKFGLHPHQPAAGFQQRNYSSGMKCLTVFPDGSLQVLYPSGCVALVVVVTEANGRVCIVYDDSDVPEQPIRAMFQSDGRATCYSSNGSIWLSLGQSGGQRLDQSGARVQRWNWGSLGLGSPTPLRPLFLSLNKNIGVRVLGRDQVFVSFLCCGQQARFSVGISCVQCQVDCMNICHNPSIRSEELFLLAGRMGVSLAMEGLRYCLRRLSRHKPFKAQLGMRHHMGLIRKLLAASTTVGIGASDKAFIHRCLQGYL
ncbi:unnamed protein product [Gadus morhua 'NCC']